MPKIFLATPMYGGNCTAGYTSSVLGLYQTCNNRNIQIENIFLTNESLITRARNCLVNIFEKTDCTHLLFIDADIAFDANQVLDMVDADKDIICGLYPKKYLRWDNIAYAAKNDVEPQYLNKYGCDYTVNSIDNKPITLSSNNRVPVKVKEAGTGMMLIKREVFEKLSDKVKTFKCGMNVHGLIDMQDTIKLFFDTNISPDDGKMESEDFAFCRKWRENGGDIWIAPWVELKHIGTHVFG